MMKVYVLNSVIVCDTDNDWQNLPRNEHNFLRDCFGYWEWQSGNTRLQWYNVYRKNDVYEEEKLRWMLHYAKLYEIEVSKEVRAIYEDAKLLRQWIEDGEKLEKSIELKLKKWGRRETYGCLGCRYCEKSGFDKDAKYKCAFSGDELKTRFFEEYSNREKKMFLFATTGVPNGHCVDCITIRDEWR